MLREDQIQRYARQILLREVGGGGQTRLLASRTRVVGTGRAAEEAATYLAAAGVGVVELDGELIDRAGERLVRLNPDCRVVRAAPTLIDLTSGVAATAEVTPTPADDRLAGALAAHQALMRLTGAANGFSWTASPGVLPTAEPLP